MPKKGKKRVLEPAREEGLALGDVIVRDPSTRIPKKVKLVDLRIPRHLLVAATEDSKTSPDHAPDKSPGFYFDALASELIHDLTSVNRIGVFTRNSDVIGSYAEAVVRRFIYRFLFPLRVSFGAVISPALFVKPHAGPQLDAIIWRPSPFPALFECNEFGLVPQQSVYGIIEIKSTDYADSVTRMLQTLNVAAGLTNPEARRVSQAIRGADPVLGVICYRAHGRNRRRLAQLLTEHRAVVLLERGQDGPVQASTENVFELVNYLLAIRDTVEKIDTHRIGTEIGGPGWAYVHS